MGAGLAASRPESISPAGAPGESRTPSLLIRSYRALNAVLDQGIGTSERSETAAVWDTDPRAVSSWLLTRQRIAIVVAIVSGLVMLALLLYAAWERLTQ
jgi:hypothetical protein